MKSRMMQVAYTVQVGPGDDVREFGLRIASWGYCITGLATLGDAGNLAEISTWVHVSQSLDAQEAHATLALEQAALDKTGPLGASMLM